MGAQMQRRAYSRVCGASTAKRPTALGYAGAGPASHPPYPFRFPRRLPPSSPCMTLRRGSGRIRGRMRRPPQDVLRDAMSMMRREGAIDNQTAARLKKALAQEFREQLALGFPTNEDEAGLRRLAAQIKAKKVVVKLFLRHPLHAKLYLLFRPDPINPTVGYLGSSNLTFAGLSQQGELNVDVLDHHATKKLAQWFEDRWNDHWC